MEWLTAFAVALAIAMLLPHAIVAAKRSVRGRGLAGGATLAIGLAFSVILDPRKPETVEHVARQKKGEAGNRKQAEPPGCADCD